MASCSHARVLCENLTFFYRFQHLTREETWCYLVGIMLSRGRRRFTSNHRYKVKIRWVSHNHETNKQKLKNQE